jgi:hypothetical protein
MSIARGNVDGAKAALGRRRCQHVEARPSVLEPVEQMRRSLAMLKLQEDRDIAASVGDLSVWFNLTVRHVRRCLHAAHAFRAEARRQAQVVERALDCA